VADDSVKQPEGSSLAEAWRDGKVPGSVSYAPWQSYTWKDELSTQLTRVLQSYDEILDQEFEGQHSPQDMLERALVLAAFCIRRLIEKRLVMEGFIKETIELATFTAIPCGKFRQPFHRESGGGFFTNYNYAEPVKQSFNPKGLADEIIHSSQLMVIQDAEFIEDGILVASDWHLQRRIIHFTRFDFESFVKSVLDNRVRSMSDSWNPATGKVTSTRE
jgi:hypothetical protein